MDKSTCSRLFDLVDRLNGLARAYRALSWLSECVSQVPADRVGHAMMPIDDAMERLLADFDALTRDVHRKTCKRA